MNTAIKTTTKTTKKIQKKTKKTKKQKNKKKKISEGKPAPWLKAERRPKKMHE